MKLDRRNSILILALLICACTPMIWAGIIRFWEREFSPATFYFHYDNFEGFACTTWEEYQTQTQSLTLLNGMTMITCTENSYLEPLGLDITFTSTASGAGLTASGQYVKLYNAGEIYTIEDVGSPFVLPTNGTAFSLDEIAMEWNDPYATGMFGYALEITFTVQKGTITEEVSGDFTYTVSVGIGIEEH